MQNLGQILIRPAEAGDEHGILRCLAAAFEPYRVSYTLEAYADTVLDEASLADRLRRMHVLVTASPEQIAGTVAALLADGEGHLRGMAVLPSCRGNGLAAALLAAIEGWLKDHGVKRVTLNTTLPCRRRSNSMKRMGTGDQDESQTSSECLWWSMSKNFIRPVIAVCIVSAVFCLARGLLAQTSGSQPQATPPATDQKQDQNIPDAPSAVQPPKPAPEAAPPEEPAPQDQAPIAPAANEPPPQEAAPDTSPNPIQKPPINIRTVPQGGATKNTGDQEDFFKITVQANQVMVPVTVKDDSGRLVSGLLAKDFNVLENGKKQKLNFFTSDPFAISAAVIIDLGMKDVDVQRVNHTFPALEGVFSQFDEVSIYSYSNAVSQQANWQAMNQKLSDTFTSLAQARGRNNGPPVTSGPLGPQGPTINNMPADPAAPIVYTPAQESHVMNDAILKAALDLAKRDKTRRKVIFVISDGREYRSDASYKDVLRVLLSNNIMVYAVGVGGSAIPVYNKIEKLHIPRFGYSDILPKYANATGGEVSNQLTRRGIEDAYARLIGDARNQYTLGYQTHEPPIGGYRSIEVLVDRPSCRRSSIRPCVDLTAKDGYYPAPPAR